MPDDITPKRFQVPRENRSLVAFPEFDSAVRLVNENRTLFATSDCSLNGRSLSDLRTAARHESLLAARTYTSRLIQSELPEIKTESLVVSGHQPELFHVGVWAKNFALADLARRCQSVAINLVIDNDSMNGTAVRVPVGSRDHLRVERVNYDVSRLAAVGRSDDSRSGTV